MRKQKIINKGNIEVIDAGSLNTPMEDDSPIGVKYKSKDIDKALLAIILRLDAEQTFHEFVDKSDIVVNGMIRTDLNNSLTANSIRSMIKVEYTDGYWEHKVLVKDIKSCQ